MKLVLLFLLSAVCLSKGFTVTTILDSVVNNFTVSTNSSTSYFAYTPTNSSSSQTLELVVTLSWVPAGATSLTLAIQSCSLPNVAFLNGNPSVFGSCSVNTVTTSCSVTVQPCNYQPNLIWYYSVAQTGSTGSSNFTLVSAVQDIGTNTLPISSDVAVNGSLAVGQQQVWGPLTGVNDGTVEVMLTPSTASNQNNLNVYISTSRVPSAVCSVQTCVARTTSCTVKVSTGCQLVSGNWYINVINNGNTMTNFSLLAIVRAAPNITQVVAGGLAGVNMISLYNTAYYSIQRNIQNISTANLTVTVNSLTTGSFLVSISSSPYGGSSCTTSTCTITAGTSCSINNIEACQSGFGSTLYVSVKLTAVTSGTTAQFAISATEVATPVTDLTYDSNVAGSASTTTPGNFDFPDPGALVVGSDFVLSLVNITPASNVRVLTARNFLPAAGVCNSVTTTCVQATSCAQSSDVCRFSQQTGKVFTSVQQRGGGNNNPFTYNVTAHFVNPVTIPTDGSQTYGAIDAGAYKLYSFNAANTFRTFTINTNLINGSSVVVQAYNLVSGCKAKFGTTCTTGNTSCSLNFTCLASGQTFVTVTNQGTNSSSYNISISLVDFTVPVTPGIAVNSTITTSQVQYFTFQGDSKAIQVNVASNNITGIQYDVQIQQNCTAITRIQCTDVCTLYVTTPNTANNLVYVVVVTSLSGSANYSLNITTGPSVCLPFSAVNATAPFCSAYIPDASISPTATTASLAAADVAAAQDAAVFQVLYNQACWNRSAAFACQTRFRPCDPVTGLRTVQCRESCEAMTSSCGTPSCITGICSTLNYCVTPTSGSTGSAAATGSQSAAAKFAPALFMLATFIALLIC